jgi:signal recognition particle subunit SRP19
MVMEKERILYPCYFNRTLKRGMGRRVAQSQGVEHPTVKDITRALKKLGIEHRIGEGSHPSHWMRKEGHVVADWSEGKEQLIRKVATAMVNGE